MDSAAYLSGLFGLSGKVVAITGAGGGIGSALARSFAAAGATLALCDLTDEALTPVRDAILAEGGAATCHPFDISRTEQIEPAVEAILAAHRQIDVLVNCAGINKREGFLDVEEATYDRIMAVNLKGMYFLSQAVARQMIPRRSGNIINIASHNSAAVLGGVSVYAATKSAVKALTQSMAVEWAAFGIRANAIAPGHILTDLTTVTWEHPTRSRYLRERIAMERPGLPDELVGAAIMLASGASSYISGSTLHIDGGCLAGGAPWDFDTQYKP